MWNSEGTGCHSFSHKACPEGVITGEKKQPHVIDQTKCLRCGACFDACNVGAIIVKSRAEVGAEVTA